MAPPWRAEITKGSYAALGKVSGKIVGTIACLLREPGMNESLELFLLDSSSYQGKSGAVLAITKIGFPQGQVRKMKEVMQTSLSEEQMPFPAFKGTS